VTKKDVVITVPSMLNWDVSSKSTCL